MQTERINNHAAPAIGGVLVGTVLGGVASVTSASCHLGFVGLATVLGAVVGVGIYHLRHRYG